MLSTKIFFSFPKRERPVMIFMDKNNCNTFLNQGCPVGGINLKAPIQSPLTLSSLQLQQQPGFQASLTSSDIFASCTYPREQCSSGGVCSTVEPVAEELRVRGAQMCSAVISRGPPPCMVQQDSGELPEM